ncbi:NmrA family NAD(P)-binding protein [Micromonospora sp. NPDC005189]|uniref:NmrA family NAD(P)-binding protein n=1 Tax=unclassified Micromonospora TaxID=2617518 RepID=UPI0033B455F0
MTVTVFGTTGVIGQLVVADLLTAGHTVTAYVRDPGKVPLDLAAGPAPDRR